MNSPSRLIRGAELPGACQPWQAPEVAGPRNPGQGGGLGDAAAVRQQAWQEGFEQGRAAGLAAGQRETAERAQVLERTLDTLARPFEELDHQVEEQLLALVRALVRQLLRREMRADPAHVVGVLRESLAVLPMAAQDVVVRLHPEDARIVREALAPETPERAWRIETDPVMERGGCVVVTPASQVDGRLDTRLARAMATLFEDERRPADDAPGSTTGE